MAENLTTCYLLENYNNYFNKRVKLDTNYLDYTNLNLQLNFNPNDGIRTEVVIGGPEAKNLTFEADYFVTVAGSGESEVTLSRWFVTEQVRLRNGQYRLSLKRDLLADYYGSIVNSPCYIEKATVNLDDPAIYNSEGIQYNQIKKSETLLKDETGIGWIVGYVDKSLAEDKTINITPSGSFDYTYSSIEHLLTPKTLHTDVTITMRSNASIPVGTTGHYAVFLYNSWIWSSNLSFQYPAGSGLQRTNYKGSLGPAVYWGRDVTNDRDLIFSAYKEAIQNNVTSIRNALSANEITDITEYLNYKDKIVYNSDTNKHYKIKIDKERTRYTSDIVGTSALGTVLNQVAQEVALQTDGRADPATIVKQFTIDCNVDTYQMRLVEYDPTTMSITLSGARTHVDDAPYDMFAIPYPVEDNAVLTDGLQATVTNKTYALDLATAIAAALGGGSGSSFIYDLQLLPYCPIDGLYIDNSNYINYSNVTNTVDVLETASELRRSLVFWANKTTGTFNIDSQINLPESNIEMKVENETKMYRLNSPNYSGSFEFNPVKNKGVKYFNVDWTYRPYNPYIHVNPNFDGLYGEDYNDARGLICGGDFSLPIVDDKWTNYQIQNKNFQNIFDREIQSLEFNRKFQIAGNVLNAVTGTASGVAQGAMVGGVAGAIVGGVASAAGGVADIAIDAAQYKEGMDLRVDLFNYNLGNIKALPNSLTKSSSITENSKIWPFLEEYDATEVEKQSLRDKITYNGMTIMRIGKIYDFLKEEETFIQGQMIRLENFAGDSHMANEIYLEIKKGAYFTLWQIFNPQ